MKSFSSLSGFFLAVVVSTSTPAMPCSLTPPQSLAEQIERSDLLVRGTFFRLEDGRGIVVPEAVFKGQRKGEYPVFWAPVETTMLSAKEGMISISSPLCGGPTVPAGGTRGVFLLDEYPNGDFSIYSTQATDIVN